MGTGNTVEVCRVSCSGYIHNAPRCEPVQPGELALERGWTRLYPEVPPKPKYSVILYNTSRGGELKPPL